jgi:hypothetical protein
LPAARIDQVLQVETDLGQVAADQISRIDLAPVAPDDPISPTDLALAARGQGSTIDRALRVATDQAPVDAHRLAS